MEHTPQILADFTSAVRTRQERPNGLIGSRFEVHVPEALDDGSVVPPDVYESYEHELYDIALQAKLSAGGKGEEGFTAIPRGIGGWRNQLGETSHEPIRIYRLDVADAAAVYEDVATLAQRVGLELAQQVVYVTVSPVVILAFSPPPKEVVPRREVVPAG
jgi:hypothetical protein